MALRYEPSALDGVPTSEQRRIIRKCEWLWAHRKILAHTTLRHVLNPFLKWQVGHYRIIYIYDDESDDLVIRLVAHRRDVYMRAAGLDD